MSVLQVRTQKAPRIGYAYAAAVVLLYAGFSLTGRYAAVAPGVRLTPWDLGALRFMVVGPVALAALALGVGRGLPWRRGLVVALSAGLCFPLLAYVGFTYAPAAHGAVIMSGTLPFFVALGLALTGAERFSRARVYSLAVLLGGIALLADSAYVQGARPGAWRGDLLFVLAVIVWAGFTILARRWALNPWQMVTAIGVWCSLLYLPVWALALPRHLAQVATGSIVFQAVMQGFLVTIVANLAYTRALACLGPTRLTTMAALVPGLAAVLSVPLLGEQIGVLDCAGLIMVSAAVLLSVRRSGALV